MSGILVALALGASSMAMKAFGPALVGARQLPRPLVGVLALTGPVVLAALAALLTFGSGNVLVVDARLAGIAVAGVGLWRRLPLLAVLVGAAAATAVVRLLVPGS